MYNRDVIKSNILIERWKLLLLFPSISKKSMMSNTIKNCENLYEKVFVFKKENLTVGDMIWASMFYKNETPQEELSEVVEEQEEDYRKVLAEVNFETGNVEFRDAGNYMEVPIEVIQEVSKLIEIN